MARAQKGHKYVSGLLSFSLVLLLFMLATFVGAVFSYSYVKRAQENFQNPKPIFIPVDERIYIDIPRGSRTDTIAKILEEYELIKYPQLFKILSKVNGFDGHYQSGTHIVSRDLSYDELMIVLKSDPEMVRLMFPEGLNARQIYDVMINSALANGGDVEDYVESRDTEFNYDFIGWQNRYQVRPDRLEGYLFPDTYDFDLNASPRMIVETFLNNFNRKLTEEHYERADAIGLTIDEVIILASLIEREAKNEDERFLVSGVFHNRLLGGDEDMRALQSCATIQYIIYQRYGYMPRRITDADTRIPDQYNTYLHKGLPPGPICNPGISSINAALYPAQTEYYFFVARGDGSHVFSRTYEEHREAILEYGLNLMP
ncbi:MAG: endolytic transglycosylase MltG [Oscillospiraceae bacterium]|nr:endolytic transglycosylase MltG [Oscillospiraceae bacterium]